MVKYQVISNLTGEKLGEFSCTKDQIHTLEEIFNSYNSRIEVI